MAKMFRAIFIMCIPILLFSRGVTPGAEGKSAAENNSPAGPEVMHPLDTHHGERYTDDLEGLLERKYLRVLITFNRTNFFLAGSKIIGYEYSLLKDYENFLNKGQNRRELRVVLDFIPVARDELMYALKEGRGDIAAAGLTITPERQREVIFSNPYLTGVDEVVVTSKNAKNLNSLEDLSGMRVLVRQSSSYFESLMDLNEKLKEKGLKPVRIDRADETLETEDILEMVHAGAVDITVSDSHIAGIWAKILDNIRIHEGLTLRKDGHIAWAVRKNNTNLRESLNQFIRTREKGTYHGNIYFQRYYENTRWIKNPLSKVEREKLDKYRDLFKKYSSEYGFDWMLVMALAYQESGLNNSVKSPKGAVGLMQVLPSTARDQNVGVTDVHLPENNVLAGVKYLAFLRDKYFSRPEIAERDRVRLALAAYNAGPAKIRRAQQVAAKNNLDPYRWFRNVEIGVLRIVGQETVRYVSNINKYYVILKKALESESAGKKPENSIDKNTTSKQPERSTVELAAEPQR